MSRACARPLPASAALRPLQVFSSASPMHGKQLRLNCKIESFACTRFGLVVAIATTRGMPLWLLRVRLASRVSLKARNDSSASIASLNCLLGVAGGKLELAKRVCRICDAYAGAERREDRARLGEVGACRGVGRRSQSRAEARPESTFARVLRDPRRRTFGNASRSNSSASALRPSPPSACAASIWVRPTPRSSPSSR